MASVHWGEGDLAKFRATIFMAFCLFRRRARLQQPQQFALLLLFALLLNSEPLACLLHCGLVGASAAGSPHGQHAMPTPAVAENAAPDVAPFFACATLMQQPQPSDRQQAPSTSPQHEHTASLLLPVLVSGIVTVIAAAALPRISLWRRRARPPVPPPILPLSSV